MPAQLLEPVTAPSPLIRIADIDRELREMRIRHERELEALREERELLLDVATSFGHIEERHPWGVYRLVEKATKGRRTVDADKFRELFPEKVDRLATVKYSFSVAKVEKALSEDDFAQVVITGAETRTRAVEFEPAARFVEEAEP